PAQIDWLERVRHDLESYRTAMTRLIEQDRPGEAADIAWGLKYFWLIRGHAAEGLRWYEQILSQPSLSPAAESRALAGAAVGGYPQGELPRVRDGLERALALARGIGDIETAAHAEYLSGHVEHAFGNVDAARDRFVHCVEEFRTLAIPAGVGNALSGMAVVALATGDAARAGRVPRQTPPGVRHAGPGV